MQPDAQLSNQTSQISDFHMFFPIKTGEFSWPEPAGAHVARFPAESHPPIVYQISLIADRDTPTVRQAFDCMRGADGAEVLRRHRFATVQAGIL